MGKIRWQEVAENGQIFIKEIHKVRVHAFNMGDVEDPEIYAGFAIHDWQQSEQGKFVMEHGRDHRYHTSVDQNTYGYKCVITCELESKKLSEYLLRWGKM